MIFNFEKNVSIFFKLKLTSFDLFLLVIVKNYDNPNKSIHAIMSFENSINLNYVDTSGFGSSFNFIDNKDYTEDCFFILIFFFM